MRLQRYKQNLISKNTTKDYICQLKTFLFFRCSKFYSFVIVLLAEFSAFLTNKIKSFGLQTVTLICKKSEYYVI